MGRIGIAALLVFACWLPAQAVDFAVDSPIDAVDAAPGDGQCQTATLGCTLRAAVQEANASPGFDRILLQSRAYQLLLVGVLEDAAATGDLDITESVQVLGASDGGTVIDATGIDRVFDVPSDYPEEDAVILTLRNLTVRGGDVEGVVGVPGTDEARGGGIRIDDNEALLLLDGCLLEDNTAGTYGGGLYVGGAATLMRTRVTRNVAFYSSAIDVSNFGELVLDQTTIDDNRISAVATIFLRSNAAASFQNSTIAANQGDAIYLQGASAGIENTTIAGNSGVGLRMYQTGTRQLVNSILAGNGGGDCSFSAGATLSSLGHNLASDDSCDLSGPGDLASTDPLLAALADAGGPTPVRLPQPGSPAIDSGDDYYCIARDQRGFIRPLDGDGDGLAVCDIGAVEVPEPDGVALGLAAFAALARRRRSS